MRPRHHLQTMILDRDATSDVTRKSTGVLFTSTDNECYDKETERVPRERKVNGSDRDRVSVWAIELYSGGSDRSSDSGNSGNSSNSSSTSTACTCTK
jgi:hypothetical protein